jgi:hypothetical protein
MGSGMHDFASFRQRFLRVRSPAGTSVRPFAAFAIACCLLPTIVRAAPQDPAYVDGPSGRAVIDQARADGFSSSAQRDLPPQDMQTAARMIQLQQQLAEVQWQAAQAEQQRQQMLDAAAQQSRDMADGTSMPGSVAPMPYAMPSASPMQQIGTGLARDAGTLVETSLQRRANGSDPVWLAPDWTGVPPVPPPAPYPAYP